MGRLIDQLAGRWVGQSIGQSVNQSVSQLVSQMISMKKTFKKYLLKDFLGSEVRDCRHATWFKINFFIGIFYCVTGVAG